MRYQLGGLLGIVTLAVLTPALPLRAQGNDAPLSLTQIWSVTLPVDAPVLGAVVASESTLVFWGQSSVVLATPLFRSRICPGEIDAPVAAAVVERNGRTVIEVVNSDASIVVDTVPELHSACPVARHLSPWDSIIGAAHVQGQWLLLEREAGRLLITVVGSNTGTAVREVSGPATIWSGVVHVRQARDGILVTQHDWPFAWSMLKEDGSVSVSSGPFERGVHPESAELLGPLAAPALQGWLSLATLDMGEGFVQTLADPRGDGRLLVRYGESGNLLAVRRLDLPFGLLASHMTKPLLLALRTTDRQELVTYGWQRNIRP